MSADRPAPAHYRASSAPDEHAPPGLWRSLLRALPGRWRWVRKLHGGHWELVDFDRLLGSPFSGRIWLAFDRCSELDLGRMSHAVVRCEDHPRG